MINKFFGTFSNFIWTNKLLLKHTKGMYIFYIILSIYSQLNYLITTFITALLINSLIEKDYDKIILAIGLFIFIEIFSAILSTVQNHFSFRISRKYAYLSSIIVFEELNSLSTKDLENPELNNLLIRIKESSWVYERAANTIPSFIGSLIVIVTSGIIIFNFKPILILVIILTAIPRIIIGQYYSNKSWDQVKKTTTLRRKTDAIGSFLTKSSSFKDIKLLNIFKLFEKNFIEGSEKFYFERVKIRTRSDFFILLSYSLFIINLVLFFYFAIIDINLNILAIGSVLFLLGAVDTFSSNLRSILNLVTDIQEYCFRIGDLKKLSEFNTNLEEKNLTELKCDIPNIEIKNLTFSYVEDTKVLNNINLKIKPGEKIAIVGHNGSCKTTLIKLLLKIYSATSGEILIDNKNINSINTASWLKKVGILFQDYTQFEDLSLGENVYIGDTTKEYNEKEILDALEKADSDFILKYKNGLNTILSERYVDGIRPSTGQWQKIAISKFFYRNAPILILDEPTSAIDAISEANIFERIFEVMKDKTVIIVSHRFSTVKRADRIIVLENGEIIEQGSHDELIELDGYYGKSYKIQKD